MVLILALAQLCGTEWVTLGSETVLLIPSESGLGITSPEADGGTSWVFSWPSHGTHTSSGESTDLALKGVFHPSIHSFTHQICIVDLLCAKHGFVRVLGEVFIGKVTLGQRERQVWSVGESLADRTSSV